MFCLKHNFENRNHFVSFCCIKNWSKTKNVMRRNWPSMCVEGCFLPMTLLVFAFNFWCNKRKQNSSCFQIYILNRTIFCLLHFFGKWNIDKKFTWKEWFSFLFSFTIVYFWYFNNYPSLDIIINYLHAFSTIPILLVDCCVCFHFYTFPSSYS